MKIVVNGVARVVADGLTVGAAVAEVTAAVTGVAVAVNDEVVRRSAWSDTELRDGDRLEVLTAVQGG